MVKIPQPQQFDRSNHAEDPYLFFVIYSCLANQDKAKFIYEIVQKIPQLAVFILYGDSTQSNDYVIEYPFLKVKSGDKYEHLTQKSFAMFKAIASLAKQETSYPCLGLIKCDDDILPNVEHIRQFVEHIIEAKNSILYAGKVVTLPKNTFVSVSHFGKCFDPIYNVPQLVSPGLKYVSGPMYYLSMTSVEALNAAQKNEKYRYFYEDIDVGHNLSIMGIKPTNYPLYVDSIPSAVVTESAPDTQESGKTIFEPMYPSLQNIDEKTKKIFVILHGGLGNQLFQVAAGLALAKYTGSYLCTVLLPIKNKYPHQASITEYSDTIFADIPCISLDTLNRDISSNTMQLINQSGIVFERAYIYEPEYENLLKSGVNSDVLLYGYFQNMMYLTSVDGLREYLVKKWSHPELARTLNESYGNLADSFFLHIRRGDYLGDERREILGGMDAYYSTAIETILGPVSNSVSNSVFDIGSDLGSVDVKSPEKKKTQFYIFSDDADFCKTFGVFHDILDRYGEEAVEFTLIENLGALESLIFMTQCGRGGITANSTYSWWAGFLNDFPGKSVYIPRPRFSEILLDFPGSCYL